MSFCTVVPCKTCLEDDMDKAVHPCDFDIRLLAHSKSKKYPLKMWHTGNSFQSEKDKTTIGEDKPHSIQEDRPW